jgi:hypothetical protein
MLNWISGLRSVGRSDGAMHDAEAAVKALGNQWFAADHEAKLACGQLVIEALKKLMPDYDLSRNLYSQFFFFATSQSATVLEEGAKWFSETAAAAKDENPPCLLPWAVSVSFLVRMQSMPLQGARRLAKHPARSTRPTVGLLTT